MKCTQDCWGESSNQYTYNLGATGSCESVCPTPSIKDPTTYDCVLRCPPNWYLKL